MTLPSDLHRVSPHRARVRAWWHHLRGHRVTIQRGSWSSAYYCRMKGEACAWWWSVSGGEV